MVTHLPSLSDLADLTRRQRKILGLDPGGTVGYCKYRPAPKAAQVQVTPEDFEIGQHRPQDFRESVLWLEVMIKQFHPDVIVCESYHIYPSKLHEHSLSDVPTLQLIGAIRTIAIQQQIQLVFQSAEQGKAFSTNDKLMHWQLYQRNKPHANDATRHVTRYLIFPRRSL